MYSMVTEKNDQKTGGVCEKMIGQNRCRSAGERGGEGNFRDFYKGNSTPS